MPRIHVCPLSRIEEITRATGARSLVTLLNDEFPVARPGEIAARRHLRVSLSDIVEPLDGHVVPTEEHVRVFLRFVREWDRREPIIIHCYAGVSRSTAAAFIAACALAPRRAEIDVARALRAASPTASPNSLIVRYADSLLARQGRMIEAVETIGRGVECLEGEPFALEIA